MSCLQAVCCTCGEHRQSERREEEELHGKPEAFDNGDEALEGRVDRRVVAEGKNDGDNHHRQPEQPPSTPAGEHAEHTQQENDGSDVEGIEKWIAVAIQRTQPRHLLVVAEVRVTEYVRENRFEQPQRMERTEVVGL